MDDSYLRECNKTLLEEWAMSQKYELSMEEIKAVFDIAQIIPCLG
jgi:hypothetical protein